MSKKLVIKIVAAAMIFSMNGCGLLSGSGSKQTTPTPSPTETPRPVEARDLFRPKEAEFTKLPAKTQLTAAPFIKGKAVLYTQSVSLDAKAKNEKPLWVFDANILTRKYPVAQKPEEVGTVLLQKCDEFPMGNYATQFTEEKIPSYGWKCEVTIIDKTIPAVIHRKSFQTQMKEAEMTSKDKKEIRRNPPLTEINDFLNGLPQK